MTERLMETTAQRFRDKDSQGAAIMLQDFFELGVPTTGLGQAEVWLV